VEKSEMSNFSEPGIDYAETIVVGGGQAGLATSYHLKRLGLEHVILDENEQVGAAWRKRWESLRLFTPGCYDSLPGMPYPGPPNSIPGKDDIADYLQTYAARFNLPVRSGIKVDRIAADGDRYLIESGSERMWAENVVVATGAFREPRIPGSAESLNPDIFQMHSSEYRRPSQVPEGPVLVVGAGQSGAEIALDLIPEHRVWLSGKDHGEEPASPGSFADRLFTPIMAFAATKVINVANPIGRKVRDKFLYPPRGIPRAGGTRKKVLRAGIEWVGRTTGTKDGLAQLEDGRVLDVANVIWCTGFVTDYGWIELPVFDSYGYPIHNRGVVHSHPGLYFMGLLFQSSLSSALIMGVGRDAERIAKAIASRSSVSALPSIPRDERASLARS
jgi:putative flavoprotein involved in K+ transport